MNAWQAEYEDAKRKLFRVQEERNQLRERVAILEHSTVCLAECGSQWAEKYREAIDRLNGLLLRLREVEASEHYKAVWAIFASRGYAYRGPSYDAERVWAEAARDRLRALETEPASPQDPL